MIGAMIADGENLNEVFSGTGYGPSALTEEELATLQTLEGLKTANCVDLPDWLWEKLQEDLGELAVETAEYLRHRAPVFLRTNLRKCDVRTAIALLKDDEIEVQAHSLSETALQVTKNPRRVALSKAYKDGFVELQDVASQAVCDFLNLPESGSILDFCAGGGGKALAMGARTDAKIFVHDSNFHRMVDLPERAEKASTTLGVLEETPVDERFDLVVCDVPCSGSGSWRRSPDGKWNLTECLLSDLSVTQAEILDQAASLVHSGGELAYATCSVFVCENRDQVNAFIERYPDWSVVSDRLFLPQDGGDGFYVARLTRA